MRTRPVRHLSDSTLIHEARELTADDRGNTAQLLVHLAEIDRRRLYLPAGYPSMYKFCVRELLMAEDVAYKRIRAARAARRHPEILAAIADGRLNLNSIMLLAPYLKHTKAKELLAAAEGQPRSGIELLIARHFPKPDLPTSITPPQTRTQSRTTFELAARPVFDICEHQPAPAAMSQFAGPPASPVATTPTRIAPLAPARFGLQTTIDGETQDDLARACELLGPGTQVPDALKRALRLLVVQLEKQKLAAVAKPHRPQRPTRSPRHIPAEVKRMVRERDMDRCTFVGESGHRCEERSGLEFDHIEPVARGGTATIGNLRLRCRAHNQYEAERTFGEGFMSHKREAARCASQKRMAGAPQERSATGTRRGACIGS
jgi:hypothetical protein